MIPFTICLGGLCAFVAGYVIGFTDAKRLTKHVLESSFSEMSKYNRTEGD